MHGALLVLCSHEQQVLIIELWQNRDRKFGSMFIILRQTHVFSISLKQIAGHHDCLSTINVVGRLLSAGQVK